ncbi:MAG: tetratricopeptide repeat protein [Propionibacteriaceae bacterium]|nr:tetratricopeptide repeat protein [Propionibacteriaceae bacterium]
MVRDSHEPVAEDDGIPAVNYAVPDGTTRTTVDASTSTPLRARRRPRKGLLLLTGLAFAAGLVFAVYELGDPAGAMPANHPDISGMTAAPTAVAATPTTPALDEAQVAELTAKIEADPNDLASMRALADVYFRAEQFEASAAWLERFVAQQPNDLDSRLVLGVAYFNVNNVADAEAQWLRAAEVSPTSPHPWYNLGFAYIAQDPPNLEQAAAAWAKVSELAPGSDIALSAAEHLDRIQAASTPAAVPSPTSTP